MIGDPQTLSEESFKQFVFDSTDFNIRTLDGYGTFHSMGGVMCVTPASGGKPPADIKRIKTCPSAEKLAIVKKVKLQRYIASNTKGIGDITVEDPAESVAFNQQTLFIRSLICCGSVDPGSFFRKIQAGMVIWN